MRAALGHYRVRERNMEDRRTRIESQRPKVFSARYITSVRCQMQHTRATQATPGGSVLLEQPYETSDAVVNQIQKQDLKKFEGSPCRTLSHS